MTDSMTARPRLRGRQTGGELWKSGNPKPGFPLFHSPESLRRKEGAWSTSIRPRCYPHQTARRRKVTELFASSLFGVGSIGGEWMLTRHLPCAAGFRGCGKVGILVLDFHSSTALSFLISGFLCVTEQPPELWKCGNLAAFARFPRNCGSSGKPAVGFPLDP